MSKGIARGPISGYVVQCEATGAWLTSFAGVADWSLNRNRAHSFGSIDIALTRVREAEIDLGSVQVIPVMAS